MALVLLSNPILHSRLLLCDTVQSISRFEKRSNCTQMHQKWIKNDRWFFDERMKKKMKTLIAKKGGSMIKKLARYVLLRLWSSHESVAYAVDECPTFMGSCLKYCIIYVDSAQRGSFFYGLIDVKCILIFGCSKCLPLVPKLVNCKVDTRGAYKLTLVTKVSELKTSDRQTDRRTNKQTYKRMHT